MWFSQIYYSLSNTHTHEVRLKPNAAIRLGQGLKIAHKYFITCFLGCSNSSLCFACFSAIFSFLDFFLRTWTNFASENENGEHHTVNMEISNDWLGYSSYKCISTYSYICITAYVKTFKSNKVSHVQEILQIDVTYNLIVSTMVREFTDTY